MNRAAEAIYSLSRSAYRVVKGPLGPIVHRHPRVHRFAVALKEAFKGLFNSSSRDRENGTEITDAASQDHATPRPVIHSRQERFPSWLVDEWREIHAIEPQLFPDFSIPVEVVTDYISPSRVGEHYLDLYRLFGESVSHVILVPWLKKGGAELVTLNLVRALVAEDPATGVAVVSTEPEDSPWAEKLPAGARLIEVGKRYGHLKQEEQEKLLVRVLLQMAPPVIHTINSLLGYRMFIDYGKALGSRSRLYASAFCEDVTPEGRVIGYPICFLPHCFDALTAVMTDNRAIVDKLCGIFAFDRRKFHVHYQPVEAVSAKERDPGRAVKERVDVLWASRLDIQKRPDILIRIAEACGAARLPFTFHVYGTPVYGTSHRDADRFASSLRTLPNVHYYGGFEGLPSLPADQYDLFLYTSQWDGIPNVILEAVSLGLPVVASKTGGISEVIIDGETGFTVEPYDDVGGYVRRLREIHADISVLGKIARNARTLVESRHSWLSFRHELRRVPGYVTAARLGNDEEGSGEAWMKSQEFELNFWVNQWQHRHLSRDEIVTVVRAGDARWFLTSFGFTECDGAYEGFEGTVLEVGCGPVGFFESVRNVSVKGIDSLMRRYSEAIPFSRFGKVNNYDYSDESIAAIEGSYRFVVCSNVLDHTADWRDFLRLLVRPLDPDGGELLLFTHSRSRVAPGHTQLFSPADLYSEIMKHDVQLALFKVVPHDSAHADYDCYVRCRVR